MLDDVIIQVNSTNNSARLSLGNRNTSGEVFISQDLMTAISDQNNSENQSLQEAAQSRAKVNASILSKDSPDNAGSYFQSM